MKRDHPVRRRFEARRSWSAFVSGMFAGAAGILSADFWLLGPGAGPATDAFYMVVLSSAFGIGAGVTAFCSVFVYETLMWRRQYGAIVD